MEWDFNKCFAQEIFSQFSDFLIETSMKKSRNASYRNSEFHRKMRRDTVLSSWLV